MKDWIHDKFFTVENACLYDGRLTLYELMNYMESAAMEHAEILGVSVDRLISQGITWVLARMCVNIIRMPEEGENVRIYTWPESVSKLLFRRDFEMKDEDGLTIMTAASQWAVVNIASRKIVKMPDFASSLQPEEPRRLSVESNYKFLPAKSSLLRVTHAMNDDIDVNNHVNNARYVKWVERALPEDIRKNIRSFEIVYKAESLLGDKLTAMGELSDNGYLVTLYRGDNKELVRARLNAEF